MALKHLKSLFPLPKKWESNDEYKKFGLRMEEAYRWLQTQRNSDVSDIEKKVSGAERQIANLNRSVTDLGSSKAAQIYLTSSDTTWAKIWAKIGKLSQGDVATIFANSAAMEILTGGIINDHFVGTIGRGSTYFRITGMNPDNETLAMSVAADSGGASTFSVKNTTQTAQNALWTAGTAMQEFNDHSSSSDGINDLDDIPLGSWGRTYYKASVSPTGSAVGASTLCFGSSDNNKAIIAISSANVYINMKSSGTWNGWKKATITSV